MHERERIGWKASPSALSWTVRASKQPRNGGIKGYDGGKKINGRKRHALVDLDVRTLRLHAHAADSRITTEPGRYCAPHAQAGPSCNSPSPTQTTTEPG